MIFFIADAFVENYIGGAELTTEALISSSLLPRAKVLSHQVTTKLLEQYKDSFFVFGNFQNLKTECILYAIKNLNYSVLEYDYKYCKYRSPGKHIEAEGSCNCHQEQHGRLIFLFYHSAKCLWWMSENQKQVYKKSFPFLEGKVLSSIFSNETLDYIQSLDVSNKNDKWIILNSNSWIKGVEDAVQYAKDNNLQYELVWGLGHTELLNKLSSSIGLIFLPKAGDTCPRMVIEAKLLGCDLVLNDNVQHKDESWFSSEESCISYLRERTGVFWNELEKHIGYLPKEISKINHKYIIVIPFYNVEGYIHQCIQSVKVQKHKNFKCILIDDMSTDNTVDIIKKLIRDDSRFVLKQNEEKCYALKNIYNALESDDIAGEDIVVLLDGDDWLSSRSTLSALNSVYNEDYLVTYGSYIMYPFGVIGPEPSEYPENIIKNNLYREDKWRASHLRTFKHHLWSRIEIEDLKDEEGRFYDVTYDQAIMLPLLEMAGNRVKYIDSVLHVYNKENPLNVDKIKTMKQVETAKSIRAKSRYERI